MPALSAPPNTFWLILALLLLVLIYLLGPILTPFILAAVLAYVFDPLVDKLERRLIPRIYGVLIVMLVLVATICGLLLIILPIISKEFVVIGQRLPEMVTLLSDYIIPWLYNNYGIQLQIDAASAKQLLIDNWDSLQGVLQRLLQSLKVGGAAIVGISITLLLTPVVMFYLLLEWDNIVSKVDAAVPRRWHASVRRITIDIDKVLGEFLRGQSLLMLVLSIYYSITLLIAGIPSALSLGIITGMLIFIPYVGYATGLILAMLIATLQFAGIQPVLAVIAIYLVGQLLESFLLTPYLVGDRIGLHPLAVIFGLMAFGQLFGFIGVLMALPACAVLLVALRELRHHYLQSPFYLK